MAASISTNPTTTIQNVYGVSEGNASTRRASKTPTTRHMNDIHHVISFGGLSHSFFIDIPPYLRHVTKKVPFILIPKVLTVRASVNQNSVGYVTVQSLGGKGSRRNLSLRPR